jgi:WD40-like Beta Propeller Repeat
MKGKFVYAGMVLVAACLCLPAAAFATFPGGNGKIAFTHWDSCAPGSCIDPHVYTMNPDGSGQSQLVSGEAPAWSSDGAELAYRCPPNRNICSANADGSAVTVLGGGSEAITAPTWSPDGGRIMFQVGPFCEHATCGIPDIWRMNADGSDQIRLRDGESPDWSADGLRIAYTAGATNTSGGNAISTFRPNNTDDGGVLGSPGPNFRPRWSPDNEITFVSYRDGNYEIYTMNANGGNQTRLTNDPAADLDPEWSPNSDKIAFTSNRDGNYEIYTMNPDGSGVTRLTNDASDDRSPDWQPIPAVMPRPKGATPIRASLVAAFDPCTAPNRQHGGPLAVGSCAPPAQSGLSGTIGPKAIGRVRLDVVNGDPSNSFGEDVKVSVNLTDVRRRSDLADLTGALDMPLPVRITDHDNGGAHVTPATATEFNYFNNPLRFTVPCAGTVDTTIGSTCSVQTSADAVAGGSASDGKRANWEVGQIAIYDGGEDGAIETLDDNTVLARQGVFVP